MRIDTALKLSILSPRFVPLGFSRPGAAKRAAARMRHPVNGLQVKERQIMFGLSGGFTAAKFHCVAWGWYLRGL